MDSTGDNQKFEVGFSMKAVRNNTITVVIFSVVVALVYCYAGIKSGVIWIAVLPALLLLAIASYSIYFVRRLVNSSYIEITGDNKLKCIYGGRASREYPINEITNIEEATLKQAEKRHATFPVALNSRGMELYPENGVLITFNRSWIKSVFPVYFNPVDIQEFTTTINQRMESR